MSVVGKPLQGRDREAAEVVRLRRAAAVGRLMLGQLDGPLEPIRHADYAAKPRRELKAEVAGLRFFLKNELQRFCKQNFIGVRPEDLGILYEDILAHDSEYHLPLQEFIERVGQPRDHVLRGAPAHATVHLSSWGLQTQFPEMHLALDLALAYNDAFDAQESLKRHVGVAWWRAKDAETRDDLVATLNRSRYSMRMCLICCFNLIEAFINGIAWEFVQGSDVAGLSKKQQKLLTGGQVSLLDKLVKIPAIVKGQECGPLRKEEEPLSTFRDLVKPFRDSTVHASPFSAAQSFGGYDKLERVYNLEMSTVAKAVDLTVSIISKIHAFLGGDSLLPRWMMVRGDDQHFIVK